MFNKSLYDLNPKINLIYNDKLCSNRKPSTTSLNVDCVHRSSGGGKQMIENRMSKERKLNYITDDISKLNNQERMRHEFLEQTDRKNKFHQIQSMVDEAHKNLNSDILTKRSRLKDLLSDDDNYFAKEFINKIQMSYENNLKFREQNLFEIKKKREYENEKLLKEKKMQQLFHSCENIRPYLKERLLKDSKICQLEQIKEKNKIDLEKKDQENLWLQVADKINKKLIEKEEQEKKLKIEQKACMAYELKNQMAYIEEEQKKLIEREIEEKKRQDNLLANYKATEERITKENLSKRIQISKDLKEQLKFSEQCRQIKEETEKDFIKTFLEQTRREIDNEKNKIASASAANRREWQTYLQYNRQHKQNREQEERENDLIINEMAKKLDEKEFEKRLKFKEKRQKLAEETTKIIQQQIYEREKEKQKQFSDEFSASITERRRIQSALEKDKEISRMKKLEALKYGKELKEQMESLQEKIKNDKKIEIEAFEKARNHESQCESLVKDYIEKNIDILPLHPNLHLMKTF